MTIQTLLRKKNARLSLSFTLRRKRSDDFQAIAINLLKHSRILHRRRLAPVKDHSWKMALRVLMSQ
jgi:hypothetical protein